MNGIEASGLSKSYGSRRALRGIDLAVPEGSTFALLGPNGAGKTTTVSILSCLLRPDGGSARILGRDAAAEPREAKRLVGVSPQQTAVAQRLSARENLLLIAGAYGLDRARSRRRADELLEAMGLSERASDRASSLSGGLARRLSIAMALVPDSPVLFLDEPTLGLDPEARSALWLFISRLKGKKTILLTTHYLEEADSLADKIAILVDGSIAVEGTPEEIKRLSSGGRRVVASVPSIPEGFAASLAAAFPTARVTGRGIEGTFGSEEALRLLDYIRSSGLEISGFSMEEPSLDEAYLAFVRKEARP